MSDRRGGLQERERLFEISLAEAMDVGVTISAGGDRHLWAVTEPLKYHPSLHDFRPREAAADLAHPNVTPSKYVLEKERIHETVASKPSTVWDRQTGGLHIPLGNEDRKREKEVQPIMRFTPRTQAERIEDQAYYLAPRSPSHHATSPRYPQWVQPVSFFKP